MTHPMDLMYLPCGGKAQFDESSGISYRCDTCMTVVGSIGMPRECKDEMDLYDKVLPALGSRVKWDYEKGCEV
jgi:hypothetical protein